MKILYIALILLGLFALLFGIFAWNKVAKTEDAEEKETLKRKYQKIAGFLGLVAIIIAGILVFTMF